ncbi:hypothetical protein Hokovirus_2_89 [Hokovirus HKV1]|uniref:Uncharacterized protein n=1 Tax=Hokovirus HKV1 TaxID=1977638 RepID=A0A1V0SFR8_9VIRU|nr:hypothetical protein Hokovirus_2_89 [Hokovirus HKV1]
MDNIKNHVLILLNSSLIQYYHEGNYLPILGKIICDFDKQKVSEYLNDNIDNVDILFLVNDVNFIKFLSDKKIIICNGYRYDVKTSYYQYYLVLSITSLIFNITIKLLIFPLEYENNKFKNFIYVKSKGSDSRHNVSSLITDYQNCFKCLRTNSLDNFTIIENNKDRIYNVAKIILDYPKSDICGGFVRDIINNVKPIDIDCYNIDEKKIKIGLNSKKIQYSKVKKINNYSLCVLQIDDFNIDINKKSSPKYDFDVNTLCLFKYKNSYNIKSKLNLNTLTIIEHILNKQAHIVFEPKNNSYGSCISFLCRFVKMLTKGFTIYFCTIPCSLTDYAKEILNIECYYNNDNYYLACKTDNSLYELLNYRDHKCTNCEEYYRHKYAI